MSSRTLAWLVMLTLIGSVAFRLNSISHPSEMETLWREQAAYQFLRDVIKENYVKEVDEKKLFYAAMEGMSALDSHSVFMPPEVYGPFKISTEGHFVGVGLNINPDDSHGLVVLSPIMGTPAFRAGVLPGDKILKIDGVATAGMSQEESGKRIKGIEGTPVKLTLLHEGETQPVEITLIREVIEIKSVQAAEILGAPWVGSDPEAPKIGYVQVAQFQERTGVDVDAALVQLEKQGMQALVLDLRQNPGGLLEQAVKVSSLFLKDGVVVTVTTRAALAAKGLEEVRTVDDSSTHRTYPVAVLVDSSSASASEIVSGALKDRGRAVLVGDKTYGKFSVQRTFEVPMGGGKTAALKLTIAKYKTPSSPCIDGEGLVPDYLVPSSPEQQNALQLSWAKQRLMKNDPRLNNGGAAKPQTVPAKPAPEPKEKEFVDVQLQKCVEVLRAQLKK